jgi:glycerol dehydrogenase
MTQIFACPGRYIQGYKELENIAAHVGWFGDSYIVITSEGRRKLLGPIIDKSMADAEKSVEYAVFDGEVTKKTILNIVEKMKNKSFNGVIGLGGGKVLDTAKAVAYYSGLPLCIVPTIASNDAPASSLSVIYTEQGAFDDVIFYHKSPEVVLLDTYIIAQAPSRLLVAGMGDALATYFEARTAVEAYRDNFLGNAEGGMSSGSSGTKATATSMAIAELCYSILMEDGLQAKLACDKNCVTKAFTRVVEANSLMSGIGFESNGLAAAHSVYNGFSILKDRKYMYHGEYVAFGTIVMLILEGKDKKSLDRVIRFCMSVGLPVTFEDLKLPDLSDEDLDAVASRAIEPAETCHSEPFIVTQEEMKASLILANELGLRYKAGGCL